MNANDLFPPSEFLKSEDVETAGEMEFTIKGVSAKEYDEEDGTKTRKGILTFVETEKKMTLNVTNTKVLSTMFGDKDIDKTWIGKTVVLYVDPHVQYAGKEVKGLRIRLVDPKADAITAYWSKTRELGFTRQDGLDHLKEFDGDFVKALDGLNV